MFMAWFFFYKHCFKIKHKLYIVSGAYPHPSPIKICASHFYMEGLLWLIVQRIRSQRNRGCRPVRYNLMHANREWRMHSPVVNPPFPDCPTPPPFPFHAPQWHCDMCFPNLWLVRQRKRIFCHYMGSLRGGGCRNVPHTQNLNLKCTDVDMMKWSVLRDLFVSIFLDFCYLCCTVNCFCHPFILTMVQCWAVNL